MNHVTVRLNCQVPLAKFDYERNVDELAIVQFVDSADQPALANYVVSQCARCQMAETKPINSLQAAMLSRSGVEVRLVDSLGFLTE